MKHQPCVWLLIAVIVGVIADRFASISLAWWLVLAVVLAVATYWSWWQRRWSWTSHGFLMLAAVVGGIWHHAYWNLYSADEISRWMSDDGGPIAIQGITETESRYLAANDDFPVTAEPLAEKTLVDIRANAVRVDQQWVPCRGRLVVLVKQRMRLQAGECLQLFGVIKPCGVARNPGEMDLSAKYRTRRVLAWLYCENADAITRLETRRWGLQTWRSRMRSRLDELLWEVLPEERAGFASAILLGNREQMNAASRDEFMLTGTVHLLAISGLHLGILAGVVLWFAKFLPVSRGVRYVAVMLLVVFYAWLVEFRPPVSRAAMLICLLCLGRLIGRSAFSLNSLALAGLGVLAINPTDAFAIGPQFSFLAVFALGILRPEGRDEDPLERLIRRTRPWLVRQWNRFWEKMWGALRVSFVLTLVTLPLTAFYFHLLVPIGIVANPLVLLPMGLSLFGGLLVMVFGGWLKPLAWLGSIICDANLWLIQFVVRIGSEVPGGHAWLTGPSPLAIWLFYGVFVAIGVVRPQFWNLRRLTVLVVAWIGIAWLGPSVWRDRVRALQQDHLDVVVIDVGHGLSVLVKTADGKNLLFDAGSSGSAYGGARRIAAVLRAHNVNHLHAVFVSHADTDHYNALPILLKQFSAGTVFVSPNVFDAQGITIERFQQTLLREVGRVRLITRGMEIPVGTEQRIRVLGPAAYPERGSNNSDSLVLEFEAFGRRLLLPGDIEPPGLNRILATPCAPVDVTLAPHHGSIGSQPVAYTEWSRPGLVVISGLKSRIKPAGLEQYSRLGAQVVSTGESGAVSIRITRDEVTWTGWLSSRKK